MDKRESKIPLIRFPEFKEGWEHKQLNELLKVSKKKNKDLKYSKEEVLSVSGELGIVNQIEHLGRSYAGASVHNYGVVENGDIVYTKSPLKENPYGIIKLNKGVPGIVSTLYAVYNVKENEADGEFIEHYFSLDANTNRYLRPLVRKGAKNDMKINNEYVLHDRIFVPKKEEQKRIAHFFNVIDTKINKLKEKHNLLEDYKKGIIQKIFTQEIRFKKEDGRDFADWQVKKLSDIAVKKSSSISANTITDCVGSYNIYGASGLFQTVDFFEEKEDYIAIVKDGAGVGNNFLCEPYSSVLGTLEILKPKNNQTNLFFLFGLLSRVNFKKYITGSTIPHIYFKDYSKEKIQIPELEEQNKIADFLSNLDNKIENVSSQIEDLKVYKKALLQQMFCY
ncbi:restriction endonuclease subunit S [Gaetbulibacter sp. PBL-D1]|uniref:restriction endonuclease subunit S n=1 Tax=Gaetbulibacter sp. PBL-D1 TaxID=3422594 RepID=UPI003D2EA3B9